MKMFVRPIGGVKIRQPERELRHLPEEGAEVPCSIYWMRRLASGEIARVEGKKEKPTASRKRRGSDSQED